MKPSTSRCPESSGLGEILDDLRGGSGEPILPEPLLTSAELTLAEPDALNLRNEFLHGISNQARAGEAAMILQIGFALALTIQLGPVTSEPAT